MQIFSPDSKHLAVMD